MKKDSDVSNEAADNTNNAKENLVLNWQDMKSIVDLTQSVARLAWWHNKKLSEQELFEEVLRRFLKNRGNCS